MHKTLDLIIRNEDTPVISKKNIIFLDIDGVLQPYNNQFRFDHDMKKTIEYLSEKYNTDIYKNTNIYDVCAAYYDWDDIAIGIITKLLRETKSYIVIHSGWKEYNNLEQMRALFALYNLDKYVIDICDTGDKEKVINKYLKEHANEIAEYIVIDDENMTNAFGYHFIKTSNCINLKNYEQAKRVFKGYEFNITDDKLTVIQRGDVVLDLSFRVEEIEDDKVVFLNFNYNKEYISDVEYLIALNHLIRYFKESLDCIGIAFIGDIRHKFEYIKNHSLNKQISEYNYIFFLPIDNNLKGIKFFNKNNSIMT